jgi:hypothetical protein
MLNLTLLATREDYNEFTKRLKSKCLTAGFSLVKMRNGDWVEVVFSKADEFGNDEHFRTEDIRDHCWYPNGECFSNSSFDLIEFKNKKAV